MVAIDRSLSRKIAGLALSASFVVFGVAGVALAEEDVNFCEVPDIVTMGTTVVEDVPIYTSNNADVPADASDAADEMMTVAYPEGGVPCEGETLREVVDDQLGEAPSEEPPEDISVEGNPIAGETDTDGTSIVELPDATEESAPQDALGRR